jgi:WD40 repeat protein
MGMLPLRTQAVLLKFKGTFMSKPRIFISYSSKDRKIVEQVHETLINLENLDVWRDQTRLRTDWSREIADALAKSDVLCLMWSKNSTASEWVKHEWLTARALEKQIIPILFPNAPKLPEPLNNLHGVQLEETNPEEACQEVVDRLREAVSFRYPYRYEILPPNSYIPFIPNRYFTGRHVDLLALYLKMIGNLQNTGINLVGVVGMGGVGKTQLAVEFAFRFSFAFDSVHWIQAENNVGCRLELVKHARDYLGLSIQDSSNRSASKIEEDFLTELHKYCKKHPRTLIILDNVIEPKLLYSEKFLDFSPPILAMGCNILFTTRNHFILNGVTSQSLDVLSSENAYMLLTHSRKPSNSLEDCSATDICNSVGYLPLAIVLAERYLSEYADVSFTDYHNELKKNKLNVIDHQKLDKEDLATRHKAAVAFTLEQDWERLSDENARLLFRLAGQFREAEIIPKARLRLLTGINIRGNILHRPLDKAFNLLHKLSMAEKLESDSHAIRLHPLVREFAQKKISKSEQVSFRAIASENLRTAYFEYIRLESELKDRGVSEILDDLQIAINWWSNTESLLLDCLSFTNDTAVKELMGALKLSQRILNNDPSQLAIQLKGRLLNSNCNEIKLFIKRIEKFRHGPRIIFQTPSLISPDSPLEIVISGYEYKEPEIAIDPNGKLLAVGKGDNLQVWNFSKNYYENITLYSNRPNTIFIKNETISSLAIISKGPIVVIGLYTGSIKLWRWPTGPLQTFTDRFNTAVTAIGYSAKYSRLIVCFGDGKVLAIEMETGKILFSLQKRDSKITDMVISRDEKWAVTVHEDKIVRIWDIEKGQWLFESQKTDFFKDVDVTGVAISPDKKFVFMATFNSICRWNIKTNEIIKFSELSNNYETQGHGHRIALMPNGKELLSVSQFDGNLHIWNTETGDIKRSLSAHVRATDDVLTTINENGMVLTASGEIKLWDLKRKGDIPPLFDYDDRYPPIYRAVTLDGKFAQSFSSGVPEIWDLEKHLIVNELGDVITCQFPIPAHAVSPFEENIAIAASLKENRKINGIFLWDINEFSKPVWLSQDVENRRCEAIAFSQDSTKLFSAYFLLDKIDAFKFVLEIWNVKKFKLINTKEIIFDSHILKVGITNDGRYGIIGFWDGSISVWEQEEDSIRKVNDINCSFRLRYLTTTSDSCNAISFSKSNSLQSWDIRSEKVIMERKLPYDVLSVTPFSNGKHVAILHGGNLEILDYVLNKRVGSVSTDFGICAFAIDKNEKHMTLLDSNRIVHRIEIVD